MLTSLSGLKGMRLLCTSSRALSLPRMLSLTLWLTELPPLGMVLLLRGACITFLPTTPASNAATSRSFGRSAAALQGSLRLLPNSWRSSAKRVLRAAVPATLTLLQRRRTPPMIPSTSALWHCPHLLSWTEKCRLLLRSVSSGNAYRSFLLILLVELESRGLNSTSSSACEGATPAASQALPESISEKLTLQAIELSCVAQSSTLPSPTKPPSRC